MPQKKITICYYISGHGYGHAARACQVIAALPGDVKVIVRTSVDSSFIIRESGRKVQVVPGQFDTGVAQSDNLTLDWKKTFKQVEEINRKNSAGLLDETDFLRRHRVDLVVCDVPPAPLEAARMAGVPSVVIGNFTWVEIFEREAKSYPEAGRLADIWREEYNMATLAIRTPPAFPMAYFHHVQTVQPVARRGKNIKTALRKHLGLPAQQRLVLLYFGTFGDDQLKVPSLPGITFLSFLEMPGEVVMLEPDHWHFPDVVASVDCVMAKPGYGTIGECMANGTPVVYHPRNDFAEYPVLRKALTEWGGGVQLSQQNLLNGKWAAAVAKAIALKPSRVPSKGASQAAKLLMDLLD